MSDKMREEFEAWAESQALNTMQDGETYYFADSHHFWQAWQASRKAIKFELPGHVNDMDSAPMLYDSITEQLTAAGISYD